MHVLVTGASGFLGSHIVDCCLERGYRVRVIVRETSDRSYLDSLGDRLEILTGSFTDRAFLASALEGVDCVIHSAARVSDVGSYAMFHEANVTITERLLECAQAADVGRFVFVSSPSVIAELRDQIDVDERYPFPEEFLNFYCETKAIAETKVLEANRDGFVTCAIRPRAVWGPRDVSGPFARLLKKMRHGRLKDLSGGRTIMTSTCYVRNAADACVKAATAEAVGGEAYFITDAEPVELWPFANRMAETFQLPSVTKSAPMWLVWALVNVIELVWRIPYLRNHVAPPASRYAVGLITHSATYNIDKAKTDLGYHAEVPLAHAIEEYVNWVEREGGVDTYLATVT